MATTYGKSIKDVEKFLEQKVIYALKQTQNEVYKVIQDFIRKYYDEQVFYDGNVMTNKPKYYERTFQFFNSLVKSEIKKNGNTYWCEVYIDPTQLDYYAHDGIEVLEMINRGYHADTSMNNGSTYNTPYNIHSEIHFWDDALDTFERANFILNELVYYLKRAGITVV
jgi:hypothetical protein